MWGIKEVLKKQTVLQQIVLFCIQRKFDQSTLKLTCYTSNNQFEHRHLKEEHLISMTQPLVRIL